LYTLFLNVLALLRPCLKHITHVAKGQGLHKVRVHSTTVQAWQRVAVVRVKVESLMGWQDWLGTAIALQ
jgi:hypothetical protein